MIIRLPGLIDPHVHVREPGATHKEDWESCTAAALAGGFTTILAMPNTRPPVTNESTLHLALEGAQKARCDYAQYLGAGPDNAAGAARLAPHAAGLKLYLDQTYGPLKLDDMTLWGAHFQLWPKDAPLAIHAEGRTLAAAIAFAGLYQRPIHLCHVAHREEILLIRKAKDSGWPVSCEVAPHHLFLSEADLPGIGARRGEVRPRLATSADQQALWDNLEVIDCFATDHAPHTLAEKDSDNPPPGFPGLETALPLLLSAVKAGRLTLEDIIQRCHTNPARIFHLPPQTDTWIEVDPEAGWEIRASDFFSRCGWTPFEGHRVHGRVQSVTLRGQRVYENGRLLLPPGTGRNLRPRLSSHES